MFSFLAESTMTAHGWTRVGVTALIIMIISLTFVTISFFIVAVVEVVVLLLSLVVTALASALVVVPFPLLVVVVVGVVVTVVVVLVVVRERGGTPGPVLSVSRLAPVVVILVVVIVGVVVVVVVATAASTTASSATTASPPSTTSVSGLVGTTAIRTVVSVPRLVVVFLQPGVLVVVLGVVIHQGGLSHVHSLCVVEADISDGDLGAGEHLLLYGILVGAVLHVLEILQCFFMAYLFASQSSSLQPGLVNLSHCWVEKIRNNQQCLSPCPVFDFLRIQVWAVALDLLVHQSVVPRKCFPYGHTWFPGEKLNLLTDHCPQLLRVNQVTGLGEDVLILCQALEGERVALLVGEDQKLDGLHVLAPGHAEVLRVRHELGQGLLEIDGGGQGVVHYFGLERLQCYCLSIL